MLEPFFDDLDTWLDMLSEISQNGSSKQAIEPMEEHHHHKQGSNQPPTEDRSNRRQREQASSDGPALRNNRAQKSILHVLKKGHCGLDCFAIASP